MSLLCSLHANRRPSDHDKFNQSMQKNSGKTLNLLALVLNVKRKTTTETLRKIKVVLTLYFYLSTLCWLVLLPCLSVFVYKHSIQ